MRSHFPSSFRLAPAEVSTLPRRAGCCGVFGSVPSATLDKSRMYSVVRVYIISFPGRLQVGYAESVK